MSRRGFADRRVVFLLSMAAALALVLGLGVGSGKATLIGGGGGPCSGQYGGKSAQRTLDGTTVSATWCWSEGYELTGLTWTNTQASTFGADCSDGIIVASQSAIAPTLYTFTATETLFSYWNYECPRLVVCKDEYTLKATVWAPPNPGMGLSELGSDTDCASGI